MRSNFFIVAFILIAFAFIVQGCFYHKADQNYPGAADCDTTGIRYSVEVKAILDENCKRCHEGTNSVSGIDLYDHATISTLALDGQFTYGTLLSAVKHVGGAPEMPQDGGQISECDINKIAAWVHNGVPDN